MPGRPFSPPVTAQNESRYSDTDPRFRHCRIHIRWVALIASLLQILAISYEVGSTYLYSSGTHTPSYPRGTQGNVPAARLVHSSLVTVCIWGAFYMLCICLSLAGILRYWACLLLPQMLIQMLTIIMASLESFLLLANLGNRQLHARVGILLVICIAVTIMESYFLWLGLRCYWYLRDHERYTMEIGGPPSRGAKKGWCQKRNDTDSSTRVDDESSNSAFGSQVSLLQEDA